MRTMAVSEFKSRCLRVIDEVRTQGESVVITKKGRPLVRIVPAERPRQKIFGCLKGVVQIIGDIETPVIPASNWEQAR